MPSDAPEGADTPPALTVGTGLRRSAEILALTGFAFAQPILDAFGNAPEHFVFRGLSRGGMVWFALIVAVLPPLVIVGVVVLCWRIRPQAGQIVHLAAVGVLAGLGAIQIGWRILDLRSAGLVLFALAFGIAIGALYHRFEPARLWLSYAAVLPFIALATFIFASPASDLIFPPDVDAASINAETTPPIVMLVFDELPTATLLGADGTIDADLYPNFARLNDDATWYRNNSTNNNYTTWAVSSLLTGLVPGDDKPATLAAYPQNLFTLLGDSYQVRADEAPVSMCPESVCGDQPTARSSSVGDLLSDAVTLWRSQVDVSDPGTHAFDLVEETGEVEGGDVTSSDADMADGIVEFRRLVTTSPLRFSEFVEAIEPADQPTLNYLHIQVPHSPWRFYPNGTEYEQHGAVMPGVGSDTRWGENDAAGNVARQRHVLQTQYGDALVGRLLDRLEEQGLYEETLVILASDHGMTFSPGTTRRADLDELTIEAAVDVFFPVLMIKGPNQTEGSISDQPTELMDVLPTIVDRLGADPGWTFDGASVDSLAGDDLTRNICRRVRLGGLATEGRCESFDDDEIFETLLSRAVGNFLPNVGSEFRVYQAGPYGDLVGTPVDQITVGDASEQVVELTNLDDYADVRVGANIPGLLGGQLSSGEDGVVLAFTLNGTLAAVTETYTTDVDTGAVAGILPLSLFVDGENELAVYEVEGSPADVTLHLAELTNN